MSEKQKLCQEPAFATSANLDREPIYQEGMSKRFYAACAAMQGLCAVDDKGTFAIMKEVYEKLIKHSYALADELLKQENES